MRIVLVVILFFNCLVWRVNAQIDKVFTAGPTVHLNFGESKFNISYGFEVAYWDYNHFPYSLDAGIEIGGRKFRIYSEEQTGVGFIGVSAGPVIQYNFAESRCNLGFQYSFWMNYYVGIDMRFRYLDNKKAYSPGVYAKLPFGYGIYKDAENHHHSSWDFD